MFVYYHPEKFNILGLGAVLDKNRTDPYFETEDPRATNIFLGKDKISRYEVFLDADTGKGFLKVRGSESTTKPVKERVYLIPTTNFEKPDVLIKQSTASKTIRVELSESAFAQTKATKKTFQLSACRYKDPYQMIWVHYTTSDNLSQSFEFSYTGTDDFCLFTEKVFEFYKHERS